MPGPRVLTRAALPAALLVVAAACAVAPAYAVIAAAAALGLAVAWALPPSTLPAWALVAFAAVPVAYLPVPRLVVLASPAAALVALYLARRGPAGEEDPGGRALPAAAAVLAVVMAVGIVRSPKGGSSLAWAIGFLGLGLFLPLVARRDAAAVGHLRAALPLMAAVLGAFALVETFVLHGNPLLDWAYSSAPSPLVQKWSVYRATTTLGHPLLNATFFAVALPLALSRLLDHRTAGRLAVAGLVAGGLLATSSRGGFAAAGAGLAVFALAAGRTTRAGGARRGRVAVTAGIVVVLAVGAMAGGLNKRSESAEGNRSYVYRASAARTGFDLARQSKFAGVGPGLAQFTKERTPGRGNDLTLENSWLEFLVANGIAGVAALAWLLVAAVLAALRRRDAGAAGALVAYAVMAGSFNLIEAHRPAHLLLGAVLAVGFGAARAAPAVEPAVEPAAGTESVGVGR